MADKKVSDLPSLNGADVDAADLLYIVDSSAGAAGSKKITVGQYQLAPVSGGTANTVVYLNGSKVESSSSALTFDGTNLGIGTSSPGEKLAVSQGNIYALRTGGAKLRLADQNNEVSVESSPTGVVSNMIFKTTATTQMTLDSSGNLGIGTSSPAQRLDVSGAQNSVQARFGNVAGRGLEISTALIAGTNDAGSVLNAKGATSGTLIFQTDSTERARITSGGDLLVGTATTPSSSNAGFVVAKDADGTYLRNACTITTSRTHFEFVNGNGTVGTISTNASATAYNTSSDRRLKEGIAPAADAGPIIDAIEVVQHDWKVGGHTRFGVIAQDLNAVAPEAVSAGDDGDEIKKTWGVDYSKLVPMLIKEIQSLRARVAALEAK